YKVYRDGVEIFEIFDPNELTYDDLCLNGGTYEYWVTAVYDNGESDPSNAEEVTVVLNPPQNVSAIVQGWNNVFITWDVPATRDLEYYNIYRNGDLIGNVTSTFYLDVGLEAGTYTYNITAVYCGGWESEFSSNNIVYVDVGDTPIPLVTELNGNYPNPFNPETSIKFALNEAGQVRIDVFNLKGQHVRTVVNEHLEASYHSVVWDGKDTNGVNVSSGVYFYKMDAGKYTSTKKMILMK
ncbi:MAG: T9SS type A sorting domain-containing protein, partial [Armatimonadetes bacterium]|nr:T9SS type A sorting domain-containing protein [Armatimonadota bacterium]